MAQHETNQALHNMQRQLRAERDHTQYIGKKYSELRVRCLHVLQFLINKEVVSKIGKQ